MNAFDELLALAQRRAGFEETNWSYSSATYLAEIKSEIDEVTREIPKNRPCYLEDELGDILWDYLNLVLTLQQESGIKIESILKRAARKYKARISGIERGEVWADIKRRQQKALAEEQATASQVNKLHRPTET